MAKSSVEEIRTRFDNDVERFSDLETGQSATIDAPLALEEITLAAAAMTPQARSVLDIGCGAGNYTLKMLQALPGLDCALNDLSRPMLDRACRRVSAATDGSVETMQADVRDVDLGEARHDIILAAAVLHHLREESEWRAVFAKIHRCLRPGGSFWVFDMVTHRNPAVHGLMWARYGDYLAGFKGTGYRDTVFDYIEKEDTPRPLLFQTDLMREVGFSQVDILHKNSVFAAFGGLK